MRSSLNATALWLLASQCPTTTRFLTSVGVMPKARRFRVVRRVVGSNPAVPTVL